MSLVSDLIKDSEKYKEQIDQLSTETIVRLAGNREAALELAQKIIETDSSEDLSAEYLNAVADEVQSLAKMIWKERTER